ncbi:hypothetical protein C8T65DRAFT_662435 [Cerioporus squamosus]|nr:hypothetical protein C8T65DRAFT_662435 [Cerioporus squamosus]
MSRSNRLSGVSNACDKCASVRTRSRPSSYCATVVRRRWTFIRLGRRACAPSNCEPAIGRRICHRTRRVTTCRATCLRGRHTHGIRCGTPSAEDAAAAPSHSDVPAVLSGESSLCVTVLAANVARPARLGLRPQPALRICRSTWVCDTVPASILGISLSVGEELTEFWGAGGVDAATARRCVCAAMSLVSYVLEASGDNCEPPSVREGVTWQ